MNITEYTAARIGLPLTALLGARAAGAALPTRLLIFKMGDNQTSQGTFIVDDSTIANLSAVQKRIGRERVPIGFEHNIDKGSAEYERTREPRAIAAKGATVVGMAGKGILLDAIDWTTLGAETIGNYEDLSPTPLYNKETRVVHGILSASLVKAGAIYGLTLDASEAMARLSAAPDDEPQPTGFDRVVAAFQKENAGRLARETAYLSASPALDPGLKGMDRTIASFDAENKRNAEYCRITGLAVSH